MVTKHKKIVNLTKCALTCHICDTENVLTRAKVRHQCLFDLVSRVACSVFLHFHNHLLDILNELILPSLENKSQMLSTKIKVKPFLNLRPYLCHERSWL